jgi:hypothetical protein
MASATFLTKCDTDGEVGNKPKLTLDARLTNWITDW